ncbi:YndJ family protein [Halosimplex rubrum]|uniref:YndJ family protein n=1 Tax=Halosimplex rubrum TaxID=869889 RepID=A0A7D5P2L9_9EURY|nr:YndJ family protein [Halosimplex rubrum]QLH79197.1 YndJ family protein [Halosimplex rubrum]
MSGAEAGEDTATAEGPGADPDPDPFARLVAGVSLADLSAVFGAGLWVVLAAAGGLSQVERALALAPLVVVPLGVGLAARGAFPGLSGRLLGAAVALLPVGASLMALSLVVDAGPVAAGLAAPWVFVTSLLALAGVSRAVERESGRGRGADGSGGTDESVALAPALVDAGLAYAPVAAVALVFSHLGITFGFGPTIILLTAVHFHFAGFALPVLAGVTGRRIGGFEGATRAVAGVLLVGPALIAIGISFSPLVEVVAVGVFTLAVAAFGLLALVRAVPSLGALPAALVGLSALALPASMVLALGYGIAAFSGTNPLGLSIGRMVTLHGSLNAYGFALCGVIGWRFTTAAAEA